MSCSAFIEISPATERRGPTRIGRRGPAFELMAVMPTGAVKALVLHTQAAPTASKTLLLRIFVEEAVREEKEKNQNQTCFV
jgi:hypothetical protein